MLQHNSRPGHRDTASSSGHRYDSLYRRGILQTGTLRQRYRAQFTGSKENGWTLVPQTNPANRVTAGAEITVRYGSDLGQFDYRAKVLKLNPAGTKALVRSIKHHDGKVAKEHRWVSVSELVAANRREIWSDGTRLTPGVIGGPYTNSSIIVVDRTNDRVLRTFLETEVRGIAKNKSESHLERIDAVTRLVRGKLAYNVDTDVHINNHEVLLGDYLAAGSGVCRNFAALAKVAIDSLEIPGLHTSFVMGDALTLQAQPHGGRHAWLEIVLPNGRRYAVDPTWIKPNAEHRATEAGGLAPIATFYARHQHEPLYTETAISPSQVGTHAHNVALQAPKVNRDKIDRKPRNAEPTYLPPKLRKSSRLSDTALRPGRKFVWRFQDRDHSIDPTATILKVRGDMVKIQARHRTTQTTTEPNGTIKQSQVSMRFTRWVPKAHVEPALQVVALGKSFIIRNNEGGRVSVVSISTKDKALRGFLKEEIEPISKRASNPQSKIATALGLVRRKLGEKPLAKQAPHRKTLGAYLTADSVRSRPYAALAIVAIQELRIPGVEVRLVKGTRHARNMTVQRTDMWLEVQFPSALGEIRLGVDPRTGTIELTKDFYSRQQRAPRYEFGPGDPFP